MKTTIRITPKDAYLSRASRKHYGLPVGIARFDYWATLYRVVDEREMAAILRSKKVTGGSWSVMAERHWGASWGGDLDQVVKFGLGWGSPGPRQRLKGALFVLEFDANGKEFIHIDPKRMWKLSEDPWAEELTEDVVMDIDVKKLCTTSLGCSVKDVNLQNLDAIHRLDRETKVLQRVPQAGIREYLKWKKTVDKDATWNDFMAERKGRRRAAASVSAATTRLPKELRPLFKLVQKYATGCRLNKPYPPAEGASKLGKALTGQCDNAASMFKYLAGGAALGWKTMRIRASHWPEAGVSHYFVVHQPTKLRVDPTVAQFTIPVPYEKARGGTSGGERRDPKGGPHLPKKSALEGVQRLLKDPKAAAAIAQAQAWSRDHSGDHMALTQPSPGADVNEEFIFTLMKGRAVKADMLALNLPPLAQEELETKLGPMGRSRLNPNIAREVKNALRKKQDKLVVSPEAAKFIIKELEHSLKTLSDPSFADEPSLVYHKDAIEYALKHLKPVRAHVPAGPASAIMGMIDEVRRAARAGAPVDIVEAHALVAAAGDVLRAKKGKCPKDGCVVKRSGEWRVVSNKTGKLWPAKYKSKKSATDALAAYHLRKKGVPPPA